MRSWVISALALGVVLTPSQGPRAQESGMSVETTEELARVCGMDDRAFCYGYINGAGQFYRALVADEDVGMEPFVCPGRAVSEDEAITVFLDWFDDNPDAATQPAIDGLFRAWVAAFPCE